MTLAPNTVRNWTDPVSDEAEVFVWRPSHWASWMFSVSDYSQSADAASKTIHFGRGGFQGARGSDHGAEFFFSHVREELDNPTE
eukprot:COSAG06_NODE_48024_length_335_cov_0.661017_1_plen_83_part_10